MSRTPPRWRQLWQALALAALVLVLPAVAYAQAKAVPTRDVLFEWDAEAKLLYLSVGFRDLAKAEVAPPPPPKPVEPPPAPVVTPKPAAPTPPP